MNRSLNLTPMRSMRVAMFFTVILVLALPSITRHSAMEAATCVTNPVVINNADSGAGSLRQAILDACDGTTITFANTVASPITLSSELAIDKSLTIQGPGANALTISGNNAVRVFNIGSVNPAINVTLSGLTIANGNATPMLIPLLGEGSYGGGIFNSATGTLTIANSTVCRNVARVGSCCNNLGGGVFNNEGTVDVVGSTISQNAGDTAGGGILNFMGSTIVTNSSVSGNTGAGISSDNGSLTVTNSSISGNRANGDGGGISNFEGSVSISGTTISSNIAYLGGGLLSDRGIVNVTNTTFTGNSAIAGEGGAIATYVETVNVTNSTISGNTTTTSGGGIYNAVSTVTIRNTIIALNGANRDGPDVSKPFPTGSFNSQGHNLIGIGDGGPGFTNGVNHDQVGSGAAPLDPKLGPLQNNGGPTATMALLPGSPAIDAGDDSVLGSPFFLTTDQRGPGFPRRSGVHVDIGAFELQVFFDTCLKDDRSGNLLQFNSTSGQYKFIRCSDGFMLSGTGLVRLVNGILTLTDSKPDRRVSAGFITSQRTGSATIYIMIGQGVWQTFRINSTNPAAVCGC
jgi:hypothetical protein